MLEQTMTKEAVILKLSDLPPDGLAEVHALHRLLTVQNRKEVPAPSRPRTAGEHPAFGIWADRPEVQEPGAIH